MMNKHLNILNKKEQKILNKKKGIIEEKLEPLVDKVESKVPKTIKRTLDIAFNKAFQIIFEDGTKYIEKLYNKNKIQFVHNINDCEIAKNINGKTIRKMDRHARKSKLLNISIATLEGAGLGLLGMGLPDIPIFTAMILKTIFEISLSYGYLYELCEEKVYILNLINAALTRGEVQQKYNLNVNEIAYKIDNHISVYYELNKEISNTSRILSNSMLTSKFLQGIPVVGMIGSITNCKIINKISKYSAIKYKKRYLNNKKR